MFSKKFTVTQADLAFANVRNPGQRRITYPQFKHALFLIGRQLYPSEAEEASFGRVCSTIERCGGPAAHDVTEAATAKGLYGRLTGDGAGVYIPQAARKREPTPTFTHLGPPSGADSDLKRVYLAFCCYGDPSGTCTTLDNVKWAKMAREAGLLKTPRFTPMDADLAFSQARAADSRRINFKAFKQCLGLSALKLFPDLDPEDAWHRTANLIIQTGGPETVATEDATGTGVYARLVRGNGKSSEARPPSGSSRRASDDGAPREPPSLLTVFLEYCRRFSGTADSVDNKTLRKMLSHAGLIGEGRLTATEVNNAFSRVRMPEARRIRYEAFLDFLGQCGELAFPSEDRRDARAEMERRICQAGWPEGAGVR